MKVLAPTIRTVGHEVRVEAKVALDDGTTTLWYSVDSQYADYLDTDSMDAFMAPLLILAMHRGERLILDGPVSEKLYFNLSNYGISILTKMFPTLHAIEIAPAELLGSGTWKNREEKAAKVVTGFSGGVDSFCLVADHLSSDMPDGYRITHFVFNNVGSHGSGGRELFQKRFQRLKPFFERVGVPCIRIDSNLDESFAPLGFQKTHSVRNVSAVLALQSAFRKYLYASGLPYEQCGIAETYDIAYADPILLPLMGTERLEVMSSGCQFSRVQKTERIVDVELSHEFLNVCVNKRVEGRNCSRCWKCLRTLLTLEILGSLESYERVFDLRAYFEERPRYLETVLSSNDPLLKEIVHLAEERGYAFPLRGRLLALARRGRHLILRR